MTKLSEFVKGNIALIRAKYLLTKIFTMRPTCITPTLRYHLCRVRFFPVYPDISSG